MLWTSNRHMQVIFIFNKRKQCYNFASTWNTLKKDFCLKNKISFFIKHWIKTYNLNHTNITNICYCYIIIFKVKSVLQIHQWTPLNMCFCGLVPWLAVYRDGIHCSLDSLALWPRIWIVEMFWHLESIQRSGGKRWTNDTALKIFLQI